LSTPNGCACGAGAAAPEVRWGAARAAPPRLRVTWLGTSSGAPTPGRNVSSIAYRTPAGTLLVDCGEGTCRQAWAQGRVGQDFLTLPVAAAASSHPGLHASIMSHAASPCRTRSASGRAALTGGRAITGAMQGALTGHRGTPQVQAAGINPATIQRVLLTHLHGDHCFGAPGLLAAISAARAGGPLAAEPLLVVGPPGLGALLRSALGFGAAPLAMPVLVVELTVDPAASHAPAPMEGIGFGSGAGVHVARLGPDQPAVAEAALARLRGGRGPGGRGRGGTRRAMRDEHSVWPPAACLPCGLARRLMSNSAHSVSGPRFCESVSVWWQPMHGLATDPLASRQCPLARASQSFAHAHCAAC